MELSTQPQGFSGNFSQCESYYYGLFNNPELQSENCPTPFPFQKSVLENAVTIINDFAGSISGLCSLPTFSLFSNGKVSESAIPKGLGRFQTSEGLLGFSIKACRLSDQNECEKDQSAFITMSKDCKWVKGLFEKIDIPIDYEHMSLKHTRDPEISFNFFDDRKQTWYKNQNFSASFFDPNNQATLKRISEPKQPKLFTNDARKCEKKFSERLTTNPLSKKALKYITKTLGGIGKLCAIYEVQGTSLTKMLNKLEFYISPSSKFRSNFNVALRLCSKGYGSRAGVPILGNHCFRGNDKLSSHALNTRQFHPEAFINRTYHPSFLKVSLDNNFKKIRISLTNPFGEEVERTATYKDLIAIQKILVPTNTTFAGFSTMHPSLRKKYNPQNTPSQVLLDGTNDGNA